MSRFGVQLEKSLSFRGATQPFSNTYYYEMAAANSPPDATGVIATANALLDALIPIERAQHSTAVAYVMGRVWSADGPKADRQMIVQRALSGTGGLSQTPTSLDRERAFLIRFRAGNDTRGRPVYLRKWFHLTVSAIASNSITSTMHEQTAQLTTPIRTALEAFGDSFKNITPGAGPVAHLVGPTGREITGGTQAHPYLEHHQLGEAWRGT